MVLKIIIKKGLYKNREINKNLDENKKKFN